MFVVSANQDHHYLPQSYQKGWAGDDGKLTVYRYAYGKFLIERKVPRATGAEPGLYFMPMAEPGKRNSMEDLFFRKIDQWGADGLKLLKSPNPDDAKKFQARRFITFVMSLLLRNPAQVAVIKKQANEHQRGGILSTDYAAHRRPHEPATFEEFSAALDLPGLSEFAAECLRSQVTLKAVQDRLVAMAWDVVTLTNAPPLITSDVPGIRYKGLNDDDGMLLLPLSPTEFFVAYNRGPIDMRDWIDHSIKYGRFVEAINEMVVRQKHKAVYAHDDSQTALVKRWFCVSETPTFAQQ